MKQEGLVDEELKSKSDAAVTIQRTWHRKTAYNEVETKRLILEVDITLFIITCAYFNRSKRLIGLTELRYGK